MKVYSLIEDNHSLVPIEVELSLWPGLPDIHFLGRADQHLKESSRRIKSAIKAQGFEFPKAQQILVNLRPSYLKKSSRGIELAVAAAFLYETGQVQKAGDHIYYGELGLSGDVRAPFEETLDGGVPGERKLITGETTDGGLWFMDAGVEFGRIQNLNELSNPAWVMAETKEPEKWAPDPKILDLEISKSWARFLGVVALGGHKLLMVGAAGSGKTTAAQILQVLMPEPDADEKAFILKNHLGRKHLISSGDGQFWRPFVAPHTQTPMMSLIGGGAQIHGGELSRGHQGLFLMDEFFEFPRNVLEALRGPFEQNQIQVSRQGKVQNFPFRAHIVATSNLCPCGLASGVKGESIQCGLTLTRCRSYSNRFSGPLLDRFDVVAFMQNGRTKESQNRMRVGDLLGILSDRRRGLKSKGLVTYDEVVGGGALKSSSGFFGQKDLEDLPISERRKKATLSVARSLAQFEGRSEISGADMREAVEWSITRLDRLRRWDIG